MVEKEKTEASLGQRRARRETSRRSRLGAHAVSSGLEGWASRERKKPADGCAGGKKKEKASEATWPGAHARSRKQQDEGLVARAGREQQPGAFHVGKGAVATDWCAWGHVRAEKGAGQQGACSRADHAGRRLGRWGNQQTWACVGLAAWVGSWAAFLGQVGPKIRA